MTLPIVPAILPSDLAGQQNGKLALDLLVPLHARGSLHHTVARGWNAFVAAAGEQGLPLTFIYGGMYRTYAEQETLFRSRYDPSGTGGGCKTWNGVRWCKKSSNLATAAVPGTSNHGWGCAIDAAFDTDPKDGLGPDDAAYIAGHPKFAWFRDNAIRFGFSFELQSEPWHIRWVVGDTIPQAVLDFERGGSQELPEPSYAVLAVADKFEFASATRWDTRGFGNPLPAGEYNCKLEGSAGKIGATVNLTIVGATAPGFASAWASGPRPNTSKVNYGVGEAVANEVSVPLAADGSFKIFIHTPAHIIVDLVGYWS